MLKQAIIIYGGTFDPPHLGHLNTARAVQQHICFDQFIILPCKVPVLKQATTASIEQRIEMLARTFTHSSRFKIDLREITRETPSYMVDSLQSFRDELGDSVSITLLLGMDAFLQLPQWYCWEKILSYCNLLVIDRAMKNDSAIISEPLKTLLDVHECFSKTALLNHLYGKIYRFNAGEYNYSSSELRQKMQYNIDVKAFLPPAVYQYIKANKMYMSEKSTSPKRT